MEENHPIIKELRSGGAICEIHLDFVLKKWNSKFSLSECKGQYRLYVLHKQYGCKVTISEQDAKEIIEKKQLISSSNECSTKIYKRIKDIQNEYKKIKNLLDKYKRYVRVLEQDEMRIGWILHNTPQKDKF